MGRYAGDGHSTLTDVGRLRTAVLPVLFALGVGLPCRALAHWPDARLH